MIWHYQMAHHFILPFLGVDVDAFGEDSPCLVSQWMEEGNIMDYMARHETPPQRRYVLVGILLLCFQSLSLTSLPISFPKLLRVSSIF